MRYASRLRVGSSVPSAEAEKLKAEMDAMMLDMTAHMKGDRVRFSVGRLEVFKDYAKNTITVLDQTNRRVATASMAEYAADVAVAQDPPDSDAEDGSKTDVKLEKATRKSPVLSIPTEERVLVMSIKTPDFPEPGVHLEIHFWLANVQKMKKTPAREELALYFKRTGTDMIGTGMIKQFTSIPGLRKKMQPLAKMLTSGNPIQFRLALYYPGMSTFEPSFELGWELTELTTDPISDTVFEVPADCETVSIKEILAAIH